ncbi:hypothetical protein NUU61_004538 [Penicillium alfredii]|uniref:Amine oxidase domain-containing protein n=1 Tax=Penicillium alfredii TaxID=1506179 RepID=A0A9W9KDX8_9EURO|nr:uncharacterized protein NUU61_004538 [Penicillium alfredii]KAJ5102316.1 hypothetical protein NUU61_004538 [Penicillium alfredii]
MPGVLRSSIDVDDGPGSPAVDIKTRDASESKFKNGAHAIAQPARRVHPTKFVKQEISFRDLWARHIVQRGILSEIKGKGLQLGGIDWHLPGNTPTSSRYPTLPYLPRPSHTLRSMCRDRANGNGTAPIRLCIIGAGISGLYLAMLLEELGLPEVTYEILESSDRVGGRVFTHRFGPGASDYYDIGAMRFPKSCCVNRTIIEGAERILERAFEPFISRLVTDFYDGLEYLMKFDHLSTGEYLRREFQSTSEILTIAHSIGSASGNFNQSFTEAILDAVDFSYPTGPGGSIEWYSVAGGTSEVIKSMESRISPQPVLGARVKSISYAKHTTYPMAVQVDGESSPREYSAVFNTASLACMRRMDLTRAKLRPDQRAAVQSVHYDASTKVAVRFRTPWWRIFCKINGGQASTDLPIRTCVYPNLTSADTEPAVLLCSYTWAQDAQQMASLVNQDSKQSRAELEQLLVHNLALLHQEYPDDSGTPFGYDRMRSIIQQEYDCHHGYDWYNNPGTSGAFAFFGPGEFHNFYPALVRPASDGHLFLVGEACSANHAWVSGALKSAYRALNQLLHKLTLHGQVPPDTLQRLRDRWGELEEISPEVLEWQALLAEHLD